ncbi:hypothetical protein LT493_16505 [Streptomyces tricolor]|nr:hypothetical protein [Streptomyces tricolor]
MTWESRGMFAEPGGQRPAPLTRTRRRLPGRRPARGARRPGRPRRPRHGAVRRSGRRPGRGGHRRTPRQLAQPCGTATTTSGTRRPGPSTSATCRP